MVSACRVHRKTPRPAPGLSLHDPQIQREISGSAQHAPYHRPMRVLLVEDDQGVAAALVELLEQTGLTVTHTTRGDDALNRVKGCDLVLLDLGLPDMDGLDVLRTLRRASTAP